MHRPIYDSSPEGPGIMPAAEQQAALRAALMEAPGINPLQPDRDASSAPWPENALYVSALLRPGFSGNIAIVPYREAEEKIVGDYLFLRGCGRFVMVYENQANIRDVEPNSRTYPDYASLSLHPDSTEIIGLENGGRLLVQKKTTEARGGDSGRLLLTQHAPSVVGIERFVTDDQLRPLMARLAMGVGLEGPDADTFAEQPFRKIERFIPPQPAPDAPQKRGWWKRH